MSLRSSERHCHNCHSTAKRWASILLRLTVIACLVFFFCWKINVHLLLGYFDSSAPIRMLLIQPIILAGIFFFALRFFFLIPLPKPPFRHVVKSLTLTMGLNNVLPGRVSEFLKATYLKEHAGTPVVTSLGAILVERIMDISILGVLTIVCISTSLYRVSPLWVIILLVLLISIALLFIFKTAVLAAISRISSRSFQPASDYAIRYLTSSFRQRYFYISFICTVCGWFVSFLAVSAFLALSVDAPIGAIGAFSVFVATVIGIAIPALPGGFGTYEAGAVLVLRDYGISVEQALAIAITLHMSQILIYLLGAFVILAFEKIGVANLVRQLYSYAKTSNRYGSRN